MWTLVLLLGVMCGPGSVEPAALGCPTEKGKTCVFPFTVKGGKAVSFCQPYKNKYYCATSLKSDNTYSTWDYCDSTKCPLTEGAFNPLPSGDRQACYDCLSVRAGVCARDCFPVDDDKKCFDCVFEHDPGCLTICGYPSVSNVQPDPCNKKGLVYSQPAGELELKHDTLLATIPLFGPHWEVTFEFYPTNYDYNSWTSILHLTAGGDIDNLGDRNPAIFYHPSHGLLVDTAIGCNPNSGTYIKPPPAVGQWTRIHISQLMTGSSTTFSIKIGEEDPVTKNNPTPKAFEAVKVYATNPWLPAQAGNIRGLKITTQ